MRFEDHLVLARYLHGQFGVTSFEELKTALAQTEEGPAEDGQSCFLDELLKRDGLSIDEQTLGDYDRRVMDYEREMARQRPEFNAWRYFQYLALLYTEVFLDQLTSDPAALLSAINRHLQNLQDTERELRDFPDFTRDDLRRLAFFMATGSGKTLLLHVNIRQVLHYLEHGRHPEALVPRRDGRREFGNILLITPNEGLSAQHIEEFRASGIDARVFIEHPTAKSLFGPIVKVIEIHKLADEPSRDGVSVVVESLGQNNLIIVDEGHKGTGSEAGTWKRRQRELSENGFLLEYSATFAQAIGGAGKRSRKALLHDYGKSILFDYSYAHFYGDGYGKRFDVLNLSRGRGQRAHELLLGGLVTYYQQVALFDANREDYRPYNIQKPLWVMLGTSVSKGGRRDRTKAAQQERSDVAQVVTFLQRILEEKDWAVRTIRRILDGTSGFTDAETAQDLFAPHIKQVKDWDAAELYAEIVRDVFHGAGGLELWELKNAEGEIGLRVSTADEDASPYFGVVNIGDVASFRDHVEEHLGLEVREDQFAGSRFEAVDRPDSSVNILIGAKKFIEGWSSWRVSCMGLLNVGKGEGTQIIQLFGRGVRLKGKNMTLKRTEALQGEEHPQAIEHLETLYIFGWNADYIENFKAMLKNEDVGEPVTVPVALKEPWPRNDLPVPQTRAGFDVEALTWTLSADGPEVKLDLAPRVTAVRDDGEGPSLRRGGQDGTADIYFSDGPWFDLLDMDELYAGLVRYKQTREYDNVHIPRRQLPEMLRAKCSLRVAEEDRANPEWLQQAAEQAAKAYLDRFVRMKEREAESEHVEVGYLEPDERVTQAYQLIVKPGRLLERIEELLEEGLAEETVEEEPLPRFHVDWHLYTPILATGGEAWQKQVSVRPPALVASEVRLVKDLHAFWRDHHGDAPYDGMEVYLLRNTPKTGIGLFHRSGFYPDFILWLKNAQTGAIHVRFVDPHGLHHGGLDGSADKFAALEKLTDLSNRADFKDKQVTLDGFILVDTPLEQIPDRDGRTGDELEAQCPLVRQQGDYAGRLLMLRSLEAQK